MYEQLSKALFWGPLNCLLDLIYRLARTLFHCAQEQLWNLDEQPEATCELLHIVYRKKNFFSYDQDFVWLHERFLDSPDELNLVEDGCWMLHRLSPKHAYFARLPKPVHDGFNAVDAPFLWHNTFYQCTALARMRIDGFTKYWAKRSIRGKVAVVNFPGRCGSTLLMHMLTVPYEDRVLTISEPDVLACLGIHLGEKTWENDEYTEIFRACLNALCKNVEEHQLLVIKSHIVQLVPYFVRVLPSAQHVFFTRLNMPQMLLSMEKTIIHADRELYDCRLSIIRFLGPYIHLLSKLGLMPKYNPEIEGVAAVRPTTFREFAAFQLGMVAKSYLDNRDKYARPAIYYEDLVETPEKVMKIMFEVLEIPDKFLPSSLERMKVDSQRGTWLSRDRVADIKQPPNTPAQIVGLRRAADYFGFHPEFFLDKTNQSLEGQLAYRQSHSTPHFIG